MKNKDSESKAAHISGFYLIIATIIGAIVTGIVGFYFGTQNKKTVENLNALNSDTLQTSKAIAEDKLEKGTIQQSQQHEVESKLSSPVNASKSSTEQETSDSTKPNVPPPTRKITISLLVDNRLRNGNVFVDGKQISSTHNAVIRKIEVIGFEYHEIMVATKTDTCKTSGYFNTDNQTISMNCN